VLASNAGWLVFLNEGTNWRTLGARPLPPVD
jgi:hypothetical protein